MKIDKAYYDRQLDKGWTWETEYDLPKMVARLEAALSSLKTARAEGRDVRGAGLELIRAESAFNNMSTGALGNVQEKVVQAARDLAAKKIGFGEFKRIVRENS